MEDVIFPASHRSFERHLVATRTSGVGVAEGRGSGARSGARTALNCVCPRRRDVRQRAQRLPRSCARLRMDTWLSSGFRFSCVVTLVAQGHYEY